MSNLRDGRPDPAGSPGGGWRDGASTCGGGGTGPGTSYAGTQVLLALMACVPSAGSTISIAQVREREAASLVITGWYVYMAFIVSLGSYTYRLCSRAYLLWLLGWTAGYGWLDMELLGLYRSA